MYYKLIRAMPEGNAVPGKLYRTSHYVNKRTGVLVERLHFICDTLENADYLVPALIYRVAVTQSPKFKRLLPVLQQVPERSGIRFHLGTKPQHSTGCVLVSPFGLGAIEAQINLNKKYDEETFISVTSA